MHERLRHPGAAAECSDFHRMLVACLGAPAHSAPRDLYYGVGFRPFIRDLLQIKAAR